MLVNTMASTSSHHELGMSSSNMNTTTTNNNTNNTNTTSNYDYFIKEPTIIATSRLNESSSTINGLGLGVGGGSSSNNINIGLPFMMCSSSSNNNNNNNNNNNKLLRRLSPEARALEACRSHKEAERLRRERINAHIATLRALLLPNLNKTDKASVLKEVVRQVRELKKATSALRNEYDVDGWKSCLVPGDMDEVKLCRTEYDSCTLVATLCCEERPDLISDLTRALNSVKGKIVRAEMSTIGGRTKTILWLRAAGPEGLLKRALKAVVDKPSSSSRMPGYGLFTARLHYPY